MTQKYIEESAEFRMGIWFRKKFKLNEFNWKESELKGHVLRGKNQRWRDWIERWEKLGFTKNPGIMLDSNDAFLHQDSCKIPVISHSRKSNCINSILAPLKRPTLCHITKKWMDPYSFSEKKNEIIWRGKFTGKLNNTPVEWCLDIENNLNNYARFSCVKMWHKNLNIKFIENYSAIAANPLKPNCSKEDRDRRQKFDKLLKNPMVQKNLSYLSDIFANNKDMIGPFMNFKKEICQYKYILNLDGYDSSSAIIDILKSNSLMIGPVPKWHIIVNFKLEPWVHYIPLKDDTSDLEEKIEWCNSNQETCEEIVQTAGEYISQFDEESEQEIEKRIFEKLYENGE
jgi:hypothetical protein